MHLRESKLLEHEKAKKHKFKYVLTQFIQLDVPKTVYLQQSMETESQITCDLITAFPVTSSVTLGKLLILSFFICNLRYNNIIYLKELV
jgi:hypothetical protein